jgi:hypothetical protein
MTLKLGFDILGKHPSSLMTVLAIQGQPTLGVIGRHQVCSADKEVNILVLQGLLVHN